MWLVIFPEGTRYNVNNTAVIEKSQAFAAEKGKNNVLCIFSGNLQVGQRSWYIVCGRS